jgi:hypothetical protein
LQNLPLLYFGSLSSPLEYDATQLHHPRVSN